MASWIDILNRTSWFGILNQSNLNQTLVRSMYNCIAINIVFSIYVHILSLSVEWFWNPTIMRLPVRNTQCCLQWFSNLKCLVKKWTLKQQSSKLEPSLTVLQLYYFFFLQSFFCVWIVDIYASSWIIKRQSWNQSCWMVCLVESCCCMYYYSILLLP